MSIHLLLKIANENKKAQKIIENARKKGRNPWMGCEKKAQKVRA